MNQIKISALAQLIPCRRKKKHIEREWLYQLIRKGRLKLSCMDPMLVGQEGIEQLEQMGYNVFKVRELWEVSNGK